jgi:5-methylcytosine-specific restriction endonuclease McrA
MPNLDLPAFVPDRPATSVDASLRQALHACDRARECAVLWFAEVQRRGLYRDLGYASMELYVVEGLACSRNRYWQFKRLADQLEALPVLKAAVVDGQVGWTKAQQVARVATAATEAAWVDRAVSGGRRELEVAVRSALGRRPVAARRAEAAGQLALEVAPVAPAQVAGAVVGEIVDLSTNISLRADAVQLARFEALLEKARKLRLLPAGSDRLDVVLAGLEALVAAADASSATAPRPSAPTFQVIVQQCPECGAAAAVTQRGERPLAPAQVAAIGCDARVKREGAPNRSVIPPSVRTAVLARDRHRCTTPGCGATHFLEVHHVVARSRGGSNKAENLVALCGRCHRFLHEREGGIAPAQVDRATEDRAR